MIHGGSDGPVEEILPIEAMRAAMERRDGSGMDFAWVKIFESTLVRVTPRSKKFETKSRENFFEIEKILFDFFARTNESFSARGNPNFA